ncbi:MAG: ABC transporter permease, partial [Planctomycetota bacterium]
MALLQNVSHHRRRRADLRITRLFGYHAPLHQEILIGNDAYRVIGVLHNQDSGSARAGQAGSVDANQSIYIPIDAARSRI